MVITRLQHAVVVPVARRHYRRGRWTLDRTTWSITSSSTVAQVGIHMYCDTEFDLCKYVTDNDVDNISDCIASCVVYYSCSVYGPSSR